MFHPKTHDRQLKRSFRRLEAAGNNDFQLILLAGPFDYATHELHQLLRRLRLESLRLQFYQRQLQAIAYSLPLQLALAIAWVVLGWLPLCYFTLGFLLLSCLVLALGFRHLNRHCRHLKREHQLRLSIQQELARRRSDAQIY